MQSYSLLIRHTQSYSLPLKRNHIHCLSNTIIFTASQTQSYSLPLKHNHTHCLSNTIILTGNSQSSCLYELDTCVCICTHEWFHVFWFDQAHICIPILYQLENNQMLHIHPIERRTTKQTTATLHCLLQNKVV